MANHSCMNNTNSNANQYSTPIPLIGLYIAGATSVCLLLMLLDIISGLRRKSLYIPCRFFRLNSATLTLIGIASKLPVDLTTYMPSARDQLSKLTGTAMVCVCIGFFMPSLGINTKSESIANMIALSLLVATIIVNICIQMSTGIIFSFMVEHIMILCCMLTLLSLLWWSTLGKEQVKSEIVEYLGRGIGERYHFEKSLKGRLRIWYAYCRILNPQLLLCNDVPAVVVHIICILCLVVVSRAAFRSVVLDKLEFCQGVSDYGWSMWMVIITQIITLVIGSVTIGFRWLMLIMMNAMVKTNLANILKEMLQAIGIHSYTNFFRLITFNVGRLDFSYEVHSWLKIRSLKKLTNNIANWSKLLLWIVFGVMFVLIFLIIAFIPLCLSLSLVPWIIRKFCPSISKPTEDNFLKNLTPCYTGKVVPYDVSEWMTRQCVKDMNKWMLNAKKGGDFTNKPGMVQMLSIDISSAKIDLEDNWPWILLMVIIVVSTPLKIAKTMRQTLDEAFEIIYFIDKRIHTEKNDEKGDRWRRELAKLIWTSGDIDVRKLCQAIPNFFPWGQKHVLSGHERRILKRLIEHQKAGTVEYIEQLFAAMLHYYLARLPSVIIKEVDLCPVEESEERAKAMMQLLCRLDLSLEQEVQWAFPEDSEITHLFMTHALSA